MSQFPIKKAPFLVRKFLEWRKLDAMTCPWGVIYVTAEAYILINGRNYMDFWHLIAHERVHEQQIKREGPWKFTAKYLWYLLRYGYVNNPYEKEARGETI